MNTGLWKFLLTWHVPMSLFCILQSLWLPSHLKFTAQSPSRSLETARPVGRASALGRRFRDPKGRRAGLGRTPEALEGCPTAIWGDDATVHLAGKFKRDVWHYLQRSYGARSAPRSLSRGKNTRDKVEKHKRDKENKALITARPPQGFD